MNIIDLDAAKERATREGTTLEQELARDPWRFQPVMTPEMLLKITKDVVRKYHEQGHFDSDKVTIEDLVNVGDALKFYVFYVPACIFRQAEALYEKEAGVGRTI